MGAGLLLGKPEIPDLLTEILRRGVWSELHIHEAQRQMALCCFSAGRDFVWTQARGEEPPVGRGQR